MFGETDNETCLRLRQIEILVPEVNKGLRNDFKAALDRLDQEELDLLAKQQVICINSHFIMIIVLISGR